MLGRFGRLGARKGSLVTLTTDFGGTHYLGILQGIVKSLSPRTEVLSLTHHIRPQDVQGASFVMKTSLPYFPPGVHLGIVFPTVGTPGARSLVVECRRGVLVGPDNGLLMPAARELGLEAVYEIARPQYWLSTPSSTFLAVEIYAPLAAYLSRGLRPSKVGPPVDDWVEREEPPFRRSGKTLSGELVFIDNFGNLITNIPADHVSEFAGFGDLLEIHLDGQVVALPLLKSYGYAPRGRLLATLNSSGLLEIAAFCASASRLLGIDDYLPVRVRPLEAPAEVVETVPP